jgi:hypothetical protein
VFALHTCGPAGAGGGRSAVRARLATVSCLVPRGEVPLGFSFFEAPAGGTEVMQ